MRWLPILLLITSGCGRSCGLEDNKSYESLDAAVRVTLVRTIDSGGFGLSAHFHLHVATAPPFDEPVSCESVDLAENSPPTIIAYRCKEKGTATWQMIRVDGAGHHVTDCTTDLGAAASPDYARARPITDVARDVLSCHLATGGLSEFQMGSVLDALIAEGRTADGWKGARAVLANASDADILDLEPEDYWITAVAAASPAEKTDVLADLCPVLASPTGRDDAYVRAARLCPLGSAPVQAAARARIEGGAHDPPATHKKHSDPAVAWAMLALARGDPKTAGTVGCALATSVANDDYRLGVALAAVGVGKSPCRDAIARALGHACGKFLDCGADDPYGPHLCTQKELAPALDAWLDQGKDTTSVRKALTRAPDAETAALLAAYATAQAFPRDFVLRNARRRYEVLPSSGACSLDDKAICELPLDASTLTADTCVVHVDDKRKVINTKEAADP